MLRYSLEVIGLSWFSFGKLFWNFWDTTNCYLYITKNFIFKKLRHCWKHEPNYLNFMSKYVFGKNYFCQLILLLSLFFILFMSPTTSFGTIYRSHCTISANFYLYLQYFQQKTFSFNKISRSQTDPNYGSWDQLE